MLFLRRCWDSTESREVRKVITRYEGPPSILCREEGKWERVIDLILQATRAKWCTYPDLHSLFLSTPTQYQFLTEKVHRESDISYNIKLTTPHIYYEFHPYWTVGIPSASNGHIVQVTREYVESFLVTEEKEDHLIDIDINLCSSFTYYAKIDI